VVGAALRFYRLGADSLWVDEFATLDLARHSPSDIVHLSSGTNFIPPLYFLLVHAALRTLGESEFSLRLLSAVAGICTIAVAWLLTRNITRSVTAAGSMAGLLAISPLHLWYSQEARPYALLLFFACCALLSLERATRTNSVLAWTLFTLSGALAFLTHTTAVIIGAIAFAWVLSTPDRRHLAKPFFVSSIAASIICAPAAFSVMRQGAFHTAPKELTGLEIPYSLLTYVGGYSFGPSPRDIQDMGALAALRSNLFQSATAAVALTGVIAMSWLNRRSAMMPFVALFGISLAGIIILSAVSGKPYNVRYTLPSLVGFLGVVSIAVLPLQRSLRAFTLAVLVSIGLVADAQWFWSPRYWKEDSRAAVTWLANRLPSGASVAVAPSYSISSLRYYAAKAGADLHMNSASGSAGWDPIEGPDALVLTRLHHVPDWRELRARFLRHAGTTVVEGEVEGYRLLIRAQRKATNLTP